MGVDCFQENPHGNRERRSFRTSFGRFLLSGGKARSFERLSANLLHMGKTRCRCADVLIRFVKKPLRCARAGFDWRYPLRHGCLKAVVLRPIVAFLSQPALRYVLSVRTAAAVLLVACGIRGYATAHIPSANSKFTCICSFTASANSLPAATVSSAATIRRR